MDIYGLIPAKYSGVCNVEDNYNTYFKMLVNIIINMFKWENLPETIDENFLNLHLFLEGRVCWTEFQGKLYALNGNYGGQPNEYYLPTTFTIANPKLGSKTVKLDEDGILMCNSDVDRIDVGLRNGGIRGLIHQTAGLLADNISSINCAQINSRVNILFTAETEALKNSGEKVLRDLYSGKPYKIITENILEKIGINPVAGTQSTQTIMNLIECHQYILAHFYQSLGINSNFNMKRERLNTAEVEMNEDCLGVNIYNMLKSRQEAVEKINEMFGTDIKVSLNEEWEREQLQEEEELEPEPEKPEEENPKDENPKEEVGDKDE